MGIEMGAPFFKVKSMLNRLNVKVFSSNYSLYGDMSGRVFATLAECVPDVEIYSIDEAFITLQPLRGATVEALGKEIRRTVLKNTGIPVSIGISSTRTLAKIANLYAKNETSCGGVLDITDSILHSNFLDQISVEEVWGIGRKTGVKLKKSGIHTAMDLKKADPFWIRKRFNVMVARTVCELNGTPCVSISDVRSDRQRIRVSRSFGSKVSDIDEIKDAVTLFIEKAAEKLRHQRFAAGAILLFISSNPWERDSNRYQKSITLTLPHHTQDTAIFIRHAIYGLKKIFKKGYKYQKAGVMLLDLWPLEKVSWGIFDCENREKEERARRLMKTLDSINGKMGRSTLKYGGSTLQNSWKMKSNFRSPAYTTDWKQLATVR